MNQTKAKAAARDAYGRTLVELGRKYRDIVVLGADLSSSTRINWFAEEFPERFFECGIAEENLITIAAGLATCGKMPFASTFAVFGTERAYNQIRQAIAYPNLNVRLVCTHSGVTVGPDGASHQTTFDIAIMRVLPNMTIIVPADAPETAVAVKAMIEHNGPIYMRLGRTSVRTFYDDDYSYNGVKQRFEIGKSVELRSGSDLTIICNGVMVAEAMDAAETLYSEGIDTRVINMHTVKPIDEEAIIKAAVETGAIVTAEEHSIIGGLGGAVAEVLARKNPVPVEMIGIQDMFTQSGEADELLKLYGLTSNEIASAARRAVKRI
ncbi:MAG: transketolase family protein [Candidatus Bathyarchaeota archaeon]|nr:transketolase family protein [Candidatus Bathyarchaeota archaeon]